MWKYRCKNQVISLIAAFVIGMLLVAVTMGDSSNYISSLSAYLPAEVVSVFASNPYVFYISGGLATAGICNLFLISNILNNQFGVSSLFMFMLLMFIPTQMMYLGILTAPIMLVVSLYGWISLNLANKGHMSKAGMSGGADEIIRVYQIHHPLDEQYKELGVSARRTVMRINLIYSLGIVAIVCVMIFVPNFLMVLMLLFLYMMAFQFLANYRNHAFLPISNLLYEKCDPEACMSALIYYGQRGRHYRIANAPLMAQCLIYLDDPSLAQDVLILFPRGNTRNTLLYWSLMASTYYQLKDQNGLERCKEAIDKLRPGVGTMMLMYKSQEAASVENKINLMNGNFSVCKQYYLDRLKTSASPLVSADCDYYIALISYVQEDYPLAQMYFQKVIQIGGNLYFVKRARNYLSKLDEMNINSDEALTY